MSDKERKVMEYLLNELKLLTKDEQCDHSVGICWCWTFRVMEMASEVLTGEHKCST